MALVKNKQTPEIVPETRFNEVERPDAKSIIVDTKYTPLKHLLTHIEGAKWTVNYYKQIINKDSSLAGQNPNKLNLYQQYEQIVNYILKVSTPLGTSQDDETKVMRVNGTAYCYPPLVPNVGDMFIADIGDGKSGIFQIERSEKKSIQKDAVYEISYQLVDYADGVKLSDLQNKTIRILYFWLDYLDYGQDPLLTEDEYHFVKTAAYEYAYIGEKYVEMFMSDKFKCMLVPMQNTSVYDHFLTKAVSQWISEDVNIRLRYLRIFNTEDEKSFTSTSIFDVMNDRDIRSLRMCFNEVLRVSTDGFNRTPRIGSLRYSGMKQALVPKTFDYNIKSDNVCNRDGFYLHNPKTPNTVGVITPIGDFTPNLLEGIPIVHPINLAHTYIFSPSFYHNEDENLSHIEIQLLAYLERRHLNYRTLNQLIKDWVNWGIMEKFYYTPFLLLLIKATVREMK